MPGLSNQTRSVLNACLRATVFAAALIAAAATSLHAETPPLKVTLPIEVMGRDGTTVTVTVSIPPGKNEQVRSLLLQMHGLEYANLASLRLNQGDWLDLNNQSVNIAEPGRSYGGIGGGFATLKLTLPLPPGIVHDGANELQFRFNHSNGVVSGFRVLAFNFLTASGLRILAPEAFIEDDPKTWQPPLSTLADLQDGERWWRSATLRADNSLAAKPIRAHCGDCHAQDARDLKYFNYSNNSIVVRSEFHGLTTKQGEQIASYIRALPLPNPGRPWNPPYQPGPNRDAEPIANWAAGAGLELVLDSDLDTLPYLFPGKDGSATPAISAESFAPDLDLDQREIPIAMQLPDWNHWLPQVHPMDAWGERFEKSEFARLYEDAASGKLKSPETFRGFFELWLRSRSRFLAPPPAGSKHWSPQLTQELYSTMLWQLVKTWEVTQQNNLESGGGAASNLARYSWPNTVPADTAPATMNIPDGANGMSGSALTNEYFNNAWYELQILLNSGNHQHHGRGPVDWVYIAGRTRELERRSGRPEPTRLLVLAVKATQSTNPAFGPGNLAEGWRPEQNIDPRMMVAPGWKSTFAPLSDDQRHEIAGAWLAAWLAKNERYPTESYFYRGQVPGSYAPPKQLLDISGGKVWEAAPQFREAGVDAKLVHQLEVWGAGYATAAGLFHY